MLQEHERFAVANSYFLGMETIAAAVHWRPLPQVASFLQVNAWHIYPQEDRRWGRGQSLRADASTNDDGPRVWIYAYDAHDDMPYVKEECYLQLGLGEEKQLACYYHSNRFLAVNAGRVLSPFLRGLFLLHEGYHAWEQQVDNPGKQLTPAVHEFETHCFEHSWLAVWGGGMYQGVLRQRMDQLKEEIGTRPLPTIPSFRRPPYFPELERLMGPAVDEKEKVTRAWLVHKNALFRLVQDMRLPLPHTIGLLQPLF